MRVDSERKCELVMVSCFCLLILGMVGGVGSLQQGYAVNKIVDSRDVRPVNVSEQDSDSVVYYHNYSSLTEEQQQEFDALREGEHRIELQYLDSVDEFPIHIQYQGNKYIIEYGYVPALESVWLAGVSIVAMLVAIGGIVFGYERRVEVRLERLYEEPMEFVDDGE